MNPAHTIELEVTRAALVTGQGLLVLRRAKTESSPGKWELPGGEREPRDKDPFHAVVREVREETGIDTKPADYQLVAPERFGPLTKSGLTRMRMLFVARMSIYAVTLNPDEHDAFRVVPLAEAGDYLSAPWDTWVGTIATQQCLAADERLLA